MIYFFLIVASLLSILYYIGRNNLYIRAEGQVLFHKLDVQFTQDVQIIQVLANEGDEVFKGDTLFKYYEEKAINQAPIQSVPEIVTSDNLDWIVREQITTRKRIELARLQIAESQKLAAITQEEKTRIEKAVYLDVYPAAKIDPYVNRIIEHEGEVESQQEEIKFYRRYLGWLNAQEKLEREKLKLMSRTTKGNFYPLQLKSYVAPVPGLVTQVNKENYEVALESQIILSIHKPTNLYLQAFYDQRDLDHLREGDFVNVEFPDGSRSKGIIERFYAATYQLPQEFQKRYEPIQRSIAAEIVPIDTVEAEQWRAFYKLNAKVSKPLFAFLQ